MNAESSVLTIDQILAMRPCVLPEVPQWSPDGERVAFTSTLSGGLEMWSVPAAGGYPQRLTVGMGGVRFLGSSNPRWSPDGRWLAFLSERSGAAEVWLWSAHTGVSGQLTRLGANISALSWSPASDAIVLSGNRCGRFDIYQVEVPSGETRQLTKNPLYEVYPVFAPDGKRIVFVRLNEQWTDHDVIVIPSEGGHERVIARDTSFFDYHYGRTFGYPLISPDGQTVLFRSHRSGFINYWRVPLAGGEPTPLCAEQADQSEAAWSPDGKTVAFVSNQNGTLSLCLAATSSGPKRVLVAPQTGVCAMPQWSPDGTRIAYLHQTPTTPLDLWVTPASGGAPRQLTNSTLGAAAGERLVSPEKVVYKSFDGLTIHGYLYKPPSIAPGQRYPAILWIHGGPTSQWFDAFYPHVQYFAQQGFVVLTPNIRGSSGYGREFEDLNNRDWGYGDLKDAIAATEFLKTLPYVAPDKMAITGTSYGGCLSMSAVCFAPGVFQAAIPASGYADWVAMYQEQELRHNKLLEYEFGPFETSQDIYRKCSPIYSAKQATTPALVIHGEGRAPRSSASLDFVKALEKEYKTVQYKTYANECYYVQSLANTRQMWLDMRDFLDRYL